MSDEKKKFSEADQKEAETPDCDNADEGTATQDKDTEDIFEEPKKEPKELRVSLKTLILSSIAVLVIFAMLCTTLALGIAKSQYSKGFIDGYQGSGGSPLALYTNTYYIDSLLSQHFYGEYNKQELTANSLRAYMLSTGDIYAAYYTADEYAAMTSESAGKMQGIGINIINNTVERNGVTYAVLTVTNVMKNSPAQEAGLLVGDMIAYAGIGDNKQSVDILGYDETLRLLKGASGTVAEFTVWRRSGEGFDELLITATRREVITSSVYSDIWEKNGEKLGVIKITEFDLNTPAQFEGAVTELQGKGCEKFVLDVRHNPGGNLISIKAVLSFFLSEGTVYIRTEDKNKKLTEEVIAPVSYSDEELKNCEIKKDDIGKFKGLNIVVLCNEFTASAGELFVATIKDYSLGKVVGSTTYGKGKMQTTYRLPTGDAVKFTTHMYYSAKSEGYDGVGISPDVSKELSDEAKKYNFYVRPYDVDDQMCEAIKYFK